MDIRPLILFRFDLILDWADWLLAWKASNGVMGAFSFCFAVSLRDLFWMVVGHDRPAGGIIEYDWLYISGDRSQSDLELYTVALQSQLGYQTPQNKKPEYTAEPRSFRLHVYMCVNLEQSDNGHFPSYLI